MQKNSVTSVTPESMSWKSAVAKYQGARNWKSIWQLCNTFIPFIVLWYLMYRSLEISYFLTLLLLLPTSGLLIRLFIIQHDCGHASFFKSRKTNDWVGVFLGFITFTPYFYWRKSHAIHHANSGNLDHRGVGEIYTMTVEEYLELSLIGKVKYRIYRNPFFLFVIVPTLLYVVLNRFPGFGSKSLKKVESSIWWTNLGIALISGSIIWFIGWKAFLLVHFPVISLSASLGVFLFYVQHQFEDAYWANQGNWEYSLAALEGSSYYKLPKVLQWFSGNIGFHHIHHLSPRIPNYELEKCHKENPIFQDTMILTLKSSIATIPLTLWDEESGKLIAFNKLREAIESRQLQMATVGEQG